MGYCLSHCQQRMAISYHLEREIIKESGFLKIESAGVLQIQLPTQTQRVLSFCIDSIKSDMDTGIQR